MTEQSKPTDFHSHHSQISLQTQAFHNTFIGFCIERQNYAGLFMRLCVSHRSNRKAERPSIS